MEALTDDIVFSLSAFLRPRDLVSLALTSRRFGGSPGGAKNGARFIGADAEERVAKRRCLDENGAKKNDGCDGDDGREWSLMEEVARMLVEGHHHFSLELLQRKGEESWMKALHRLQGQQQLIEEAMAAAPALFAKPGDMFRLWDCDSHLYGVPKVRYVGRNEDGWLPSRGWLVFHNFSRVNEVILGILGVSGPRAMYAHYTPSGDRIDQSLCLPPEHCGAFLKEGVAIGQRSIEKRVKELCITPQMLVEAKEAAPALVAKPGDLFEWKQNPERTAVVRYAGRNEVPASVKVFQSTGSEYSTPKVGWLVFNTQHELPRVQGILDAISARSRCRFSHYDAQGQIVKRTLCIPPEKCGALNVHHEPE